MSQSFRIKDLFLDIAAEELSHPEMVAQTINLLNGHDVDATKVQAGEVQTHVQNGLNPGLNTFANASLRLGSLLAWCTSRHKKRPKEVFCLLT